MLLGVVFRMLADALGSSAGYERGYDDYYGDDDRSDRSKCQRLDLQRRETRLELVGSAVGGSLVKAVCIDSSGGPYAFGLALAESRYDLDLVGILVNAFYLYLSFARRFDI